MPPVPLRAVMSVRSANAFSTAAAAHTVRIAMPMADVPNGRVHGLVDRDPDARSAGLELARPPCPLDSEIAVRSVARSCQRHAAPRGPASVRVGGRHPFERDLELLQLAIAAGELGGRCPAPGA